MAAPGLVCVWGVHTFPRRTCGTFWGSACTSSVGAVCPAEVHPKGSLGGLLGLELGPLLVTTRPAVSRQIHTHQLFIQDRLSRVMKG